MQGVGSWSWLKQGLSTVSLSLSHPSHFEETHTVGYCCGQIASGAPIIIAVPRSGSGSIVNGNRTKPVMTQPVHTL